jgi:hypothetical protein
MASKHDHVIDLFSDCRDTGTVATGFRRHCLQRGLHVLRQNTKCAEYFQLATNGLFVESL